VRFIAVGDVNLGREAGQKILNGEIDYPFAEVRDVFAAYDIVFANLECTLSDQDGETQHPGNNLIFTGPPGGAQSLREGGVTVVSTANNHALDYGVRAHSETMQYLAEAGVLFTGTSSDSSSIYEPLIIVRNGIRIAFFACTDIMNIENPVWKRYVAAADTSRILPSIRSYRDSVDFVVVSYHGGEEYSERPTQRVRDFGAWMVSGGADLFLGHHPHVPHGIGELQGKYMVYSLGNFVFRQPDHFWTQRSFAFSVDIRKDREGTKAVALAVLPLAAGLQPRFIEDPGEAEVIIDRVRALSAPIVAESIER
jgi:poly-gamma-glutamate synthesis protein (capsule biosynthesis protein)